MDRNAIDEFRDYIKAIEIEQRRAERLAAVVRIIKAGRSSLWSAELHNAMSRLEPWDVTTEVAPSSERSATAMTGPSPDEDLIPEPPPSEGVKLTLYQYYAAAALTGLAAAGRDTGLAAASNWQRDLAWKAHSAAVAMVREGEE